MAITVIKIADPHASCTSRNIPAETELGRGWLAGLRFPLLLPTGGLPGEVCVQPADRPQVVPLLRSRI